MDPELRGGAPDAIARQRIWATMMATSSGSLRCRASSSSMSAAGARPGSANHAGVDDAHVADVNAECLRGHLALDSIGAGDNAQEHLPRQVGERGREAIVEAALLGHEAGQVEDSRRAVATLRCSLIGSSAARTEAGELTWCAHVSRGIPGTPQRFTIQFEHRGRPVLASRFVCSSHTDIWMSWRDVKRSS